ncbi:MAG: hypothetical protein INR73_08100 [Williamsia sp.]|nr:hypothetical protein [Williamsia sp.]
MGTLQQQTLFSWVYFAQAKGQNGTVFKLSEQPIEGMIFLSKHTFHFLKQTKPYQGQSVPGLAHGKMYKCGHI